MCLILIENELDEIGFDERSHTLRARDGEYNIVSLLSKINECGSGRSGRSGLHGREKLNNWGIGTGLVWICCMRCEVDVFDREECKRPSFEDELIIQYSRYQETD